MLHRQACRGQSLVEYAVLLGITAAAVIGMQTYTRRALQAKLKTQVDHWLTTAIDPANLPEECKKAGQTDPKVCAQFLGAQIVDEEDTRLFRQRSQADGEQRRSYTYSSAGRVTTITRRKEGVGVRRVGDGRIVTLNLPPPQFVRRPNLPDGSPQQPFPLTGIGLPTNPTGPPGEPGPGDGSLPGIPDVPGTPDNPQKGNTRNTR